MTSRTRFCAPKPIASPAMPAPVRIGMTSIDSSRSTIRTATNATDTVTMLVSTPLRVVGAALPFGIDLRVTPGELVLQMLGHEARRANGHPAADENDDDVDAVAERPARERPRIPPRLVEAEARKRPRDAARRRHRVGQQGRGSNQLLGAGVHGGAVLRADHVQRGEQTKHQRAGESDGQRRQEEGQRDDADGRVVDEDITSAGSADSSRRAASGPD